MENRAEAESCEGMPGSVIEFHEAATPPPGLPSGGLCRSQAKWDSLAARMPREPEGPHSMPSRTPDMVGGRGETGSAAIARTRIVYGSPFSRNPKTPIAGGSIWAGGDPDVIETVPNSAASEA